MKPCIYVHRITNAFDRGIDRYLKHRAFACVMMGLLENNLTSWYRFSTLWFSSILRAQSHAVTEKCQMHLIGDTNPTRTVYTTADSNLRHPAVSPFQSAHY